MDTKFSKIFKLGAYLSISKLFFGALRIKVLAIILGVNGIGLLSLGMQFYVAATVVISLSLSVVLINLGRPFIVEENYVETGQIVGTITLIGICNALFFLITIIILFQFGAFKNIENLNFFLFISIALASIFLAFSTILGEGLGFLIDRYDVYVRVNILASIFDAIWISLGAWFYGLDGALYGLLIASVTQFIIYIIFLLKISEVRKVILNLSFKSNLIIPIFKQAFGLQVTSLIVHICPLIARAQIVIANGEAANGYLQVAIALAAYLFSLMMNGVWGNLHPFVAAHGNSESSRYLLQKTLSRVVPFSAIACILIVFTSPLLINIFYTPAFLPSQSFLVPYFAAELIFIFLSVLSAYLIALKKNGLVFIGYSTYFIILLSCVYILSDSIGPMSYVYGHMAGSLMLLILSTIWSLTTKVFNSKFLINILLIFTIAELCILSDWFGIIMRGGILLSWIALPISLVLIIFLYLRLSLKYK